MINTQNVKALRVLNALSQTEVAEKLGIGIKAYNYRENSKQEFTLTEAKKLADLFNLTIDELFFKNIVNFRNTIE